MMKEKLLRLKEWLEKQSVNEINSIEIERLQNLLNVDKKECKEFVNFLIRNGLVRLRYRFVCNGCGSEYIEYEKNIVKGNCRCEYCENFFSLAEIQRTGSLVYEISYDDIMGIEDEEIEDVFEDEMEIISIRERIEREDTKMEKEKKRIFFGSSKEAEETMDWIAALVEHMGCEAITWNSPNKGIFVAGDSTLESLLKVSKEVDGAIFIFSDDDLTWCRDEVNGSVRDNVLFEYGLFMGSLDEKRVVIANKNKPKLASDLAGVKYIDANRGEALVKQELKAWLSRIR